MEYDELIRKNPELMKNQNELLELILDQQVISMWQQQQNRNLPTELARCNEIGIVLSDPYFIILRDLVRFPDGQMRGYTRLISQASLRGGKAVVVLPVYQQQILLLYQFRHPTRSWHYEVPRGYGEPGMSIQDNAKKEIIEEISGTIGKLIELGEFYNNTGFEANSVSLLFAELSSVGKPEINEGIKSIVRLSVSEFEHWIENGTITDGFTIAAYTKAKLKGLI